VKDEVGNKFMTAASHGFPDECGPMIIHPLPADGRCIGEVIVEVTHTGIALVKLGGAEKFSNVTFQNDDISESIQLKRLVSAKDSELGTTFSWTRPILRRIPSDDHGSPEQQWIFASWYYMGQDSGSALPESMCRSAIWTEDKDVIGFFQYAPKDGRMIHGGLVFRDCG
jgi:hypothetical protein